MKLLEKPNIILIGGSGRSGTNITKEILGQHTRVFALPFEHRFTIDPGGLVDFYNSFTSTWSPYMADSRLKQLIELLRDLSDEPTFDNFAGKIIKGFDNQGRFLSPRRYHGWKLAEHFPNYDKHVNELISELEDFNYPATWVGTESYTIKDKMLYAKPRERESLAALFGSFINNLVSDCLRENRKDHFVEDNTWNILFARELLDFTPQAKLLHVLRDPRDVVASLVQQRWAPETMQKAARWHRDIMLKWFSVRKTLPQGSYLEIRLEDLVSIPSKVIKKICAFSNLEFEDHMLNIDLSQANSGRWEKEFTKQDKKELELNLADIIDALGYS